MKLRKLFHYTLKACQACLSKNWDCQERSICSPSPEMSGYGLTFWSSFLRSNEILMSRCKIMGKLTIGQQSEAISNVHQVLRFPCETFPSETFHQWSKLSFMTQYFFSCWCCSLNFLKAFCIQPRLKVQDLLGIFIL